MAHSHSLTWVVPDSGWESWLDYAQYRIKEAFGLAVGWNLEGAEQVTLDAAEYAQHLALWMNGLRLRRPFIAPTNTGGITFEWSGDGVLDVDVEVAADGSAELLIRERESGQYSEGDFESMFDEWPRILRYLST